MTQPPRGDVERAVGVAGRFIVYYRRDGRPFWDVSYSATEERAREDFLQVTEELGWSVEIERVEVRDDDAVRATANAEAMIEAEGDRLEADLENLLLIAQGNALPAAVENDLEERGLIVQTDQPYANLTDEGSAFLTEMGETVYVCENGHRFVKAMRRYADVYCPTCGSNEVGRDGEA